MQMLSETEPARTAAVGGRREPSDVVMGLAGLSRIYRTSEVMTYALRDIDLEIRRGEFWSISGPSGGGKSTLLSILGLLDAPSAGTYTLGGKSVSTLGAAERARMRRDYIGFIFQSFNLLGELNVQDNVELPLLYRGMDKAERKARVAKALAQVEMSHRAKHMPSQLSGGQQQRVAVARAVVGEPLVLLADEPTGNLDSNNGHQVMELLRGLHAQGSTICMVTHDLELAASATRRARLFDGRLGLDG